MRRLALLMLLMLFGLSCGRTELTQEMPFPVVSVGSGGGITGARQGCRTDSTGVIRAFRALGAAADSILWQRTLTDAERSRLRTALATPGAYDWQSARYGNLTGWAQAAPRGELRRWTWSGRALPVEAPAAFAGWVGVVRELCRNSP